jgi:polyhydroxyalkanoate synthesis regulator phasin
MPASKSSSGGSSQSGGSRSSARASKPKSASGSARAKSGGPRTASRGTSGSSSGNAGRGKRPAKQGTRTARSGRAGAAKTDGLASLAEQMANRIINPLGLVVLTRERIQDTLDEAAERGRLTRTDANELVAELVKLGRQQTEELLTDIERLLGRGRDQFETASKRARLTDGMERIVRTADRARRTVGVGPSFPILGYDDLTAAQVETRLTGLTPAELRKVREYERRHANRKSVLGAVERALA